MMKSLPDEEIREGDSIQREQKIRDTDMKSA